MGAALAVALAQLALYTRDREPRDARAIVAREFNSNTLQPGERVVRVVPVFRRDPADYLRATRGMLALTDRRLIYLGAPPRDVTGTSDQAPMFDQRDFPIDTMVRLVPTFTVLGFARALKIESPGPLGIKLGVPRDQWEAAQVMRQEWAVRHRTLRAIGAWGQRVRDARTQLATELAAYRRRPVYHVVRQGDAMASIASWYETTTDSIAALNGIVGNRIRVGQQLLIRRAKPKDRGKS